MSEARGVSPPAFGTIGFSILAELEHCVCHALVHLSRIAKLSDLGETDSDGIEKHRRVGALCKLEEEALLMVAGRLRRWLTLAQTQGVVDQSLGVKFTALDADIKTRR